MGVSAWLSRYGPMQVREQTGLPLSDADKAEAVKRLLREAGR